MKPIRYHRLIYLFALVGILSCLMATQCLGQRLSGPGSGGRGSERLITQPGPSSRAGVPEWHVEDEFKDDIFTFMRIRYSNGGGWGRRGGGGWAVDHPNADLNFSYRLEQLTSMIVAPDAGDMDLLDDRLYDYPFIFIIDPRSLSFRDNEATALRRYLLNGGFLMVDDFWGNQMWNHLMGELKKVFPDREPQSLPLDHAIFKIPFPLTEKPQVPSEDSAHRTRDVSGPRRTWEDEISWEEPQPADYRAILDDAGRIMVLICWNTDLSDGWEEEGVDEWFFTNFSEKYSYPMGINIVVYALTH